MTPDERTAALTELSKHLAQKSGYAVGCLQELADAWLRPIEFKLTVHPHSDEVGIELNVRPKEHVN